MNTNDFRSSRRLKSTRTVRLRFARQALAVLFTASIVLAGLMPGVNAAPGDLDPSFGNGGVATPNINGWLAAVAVQPDGKFLAVGSTVLARFNPDGSLDQGFGSGGLVTTDFLPNQQNVHYSEAYAVAIQADGKIVIGGETSMPPACSPSEPCLDPQYLAIARYDTNGALDASFGSGGEVVLNLGISSAVNSLAVQPDGRIVCAGETMFDAQTRDLVVFRLDSDGRPDSSFGFGGFAITNFGNNFSSSADAVALQSDGRIVAAGFAGPAFNTAAFNGAFAVVRYNTNGSLDNSFGAGGKVTTDFGPGDDYASSVKILSDGRILAGGYSTLATSSVGALAQYNADGTPDLSFGAGGTVVAGYPGVRMAVMSDGKILLAGTAGAAGGFGVTRFLADGVVDAAFGNGGSVLIDFPGYPFLGAVNIYGSDQVLLGGSVSSGLDSLFAFARCLGDGAPTSSDLGVTVSAAVTISRGPTTYITYTIKVANNGPDPAYYVRLSDRLPPQITFQSISAPAGWVVYNKPDPNVTGKYAELSIYKASLAPSGSPDTITLVAKVLSTGTIKNEVSVSSNYTPDPNGTNNTATLNTLVR